MYVIIKKDEDRFTREIYGLYETLESAKEDARKMYNKDIDEEFIFHIEKIKVIK